MAVELEINPAADIVEGVFDSRPWSKREAGSRKCA